MPLSIVNIPARSLIASSLPASVDVRLRGPFTALRQLEPDKLEAVLDLKEAEPGELVYRLTAEDVNVPPEVEVISISPSEVRFLLDTMQEKTLRVEPAVTGEPASGLRVGDVRAEPAEVRIAGPAAALAKMSADRDGPGFGRGANRELLLHRPARPLRNGPAAPRGARDHGLDPARAGARAVSRADPRAPEERPLRLFGTDGLRGRAGAFPLDAASLHAIGRELGRRVVAAGRPPVVIGGDTRESTRRMIASARRRPLRERVRRRLGGRDDDARDRRARRSPAAREPAFPSRRRTTLSRTTASRSSGPTAASGRTRRSSLSKRC